MSDFYLKDGKLFPIEALTVAPMASTDTVFGYTVSALQTDVFVGHNKIVGTLNKITTGSLPPVWGDGNFIALKFGGTAFDKAKHIYVGMNPTAGFGLVDVSADPDRAGVFKVTNKLQDFVAVVDYGNDRTETITFDLSGLTLATE